ncbi:MAG: S4 domain-containing protein [Candidatus Electrothrix sp. GW3-4]|uniref:RNA-binding S4 domain-containing protein n=1 Tax=Candidatus Electrothrix sp. GW3-4 TaxID=3126740 RepID=UPI0030D28325
MTNRDKQEIAVRLDKWLWAARFFKTRSMASKAVSGGHVHLNGKRVKPSRIVQGGEQLRIKRGIEIYTINILALSDRRGPAKVAITLYEETEESRTQREEAREQRRLVKAPASRPEGRPDKRDRRKIRKFLRKDD